MAEERKCPSNGKDLTPGCPFQSTLPPLTAGRRAASRQRFLIPGVFAQPSSNRSDWKEAPKACFPSCTPATQKGAEKAANSAPPPAEVT